ncbi:MAG: hypothetical protein ACLFPX_08080 [Candidatus Omnitrophota bacterium]
MNNQSQCQPNGTAVNKQLALLFLRAALDDQRFEECPTLVDRARYRGAEAGEVTEVIEDYLHGEDVPRRIPQEASGMTGGRR